MNNARPHSPRRSPLFWPVPLFGCALALGAPLAYAQSESSDSGETESYEDFVLSLDNVEADEQPQMTAAETDDTESAESAATYESIDLPQDEDAAPEEAVAKKPPARPTQIEEIIVTGENIARTQMETTTSVSVMTAEDIERNADESLGDLLRRVANANVNVDNRVIIRGVSQTGAANGTGAPLISVQLDGVTLDTTTQQTAMNTLFDVQQVEVLRGAQSTSQGRNALGGAMVIRSKDPTWEPSSHLKLGYGENGTYELGYAGGGPISDDFAFRIAGNVKQSDGYTTYTPTNDQEFAASEDQMLRGKLAWTPLGIPGLQSRLTFSHMHFDGMRNYNIEEGTAGTDPEQRRTNQANVPPDDHIDANIGSWETTYDMGDFGLSATTAWMETERRYILDYDGLYDDLGALDIEDNGSNWSQEIQLSMESPGLYRGVIGVYGGEFKTHSMNDATGIPYLDVPGLGTIFANYDDERISDATNMAVFTEFDIDLPWSLVATLGLRYDREELDSRNRFETTSATLNGLDVLPLVLATGLTPDTDGFQGGKTTYSALLPKFGLRTAMSDNWTVFATYTEAYRAGGVDVDTSGDEAVAVPFDPEYTKNYEVGTRVAIDSYNLDLSANLYYIDWEDQQVPVLAGLFYITQNAATSRLYGAEGSLNWSPTDWFSFHLALGFSDTEFQDFVQNGEDYSGNEFVYAPRFTGSSSINWNPVESISTTLSVSHQSMTYTQPDNLDTERGDERTLLDARIAWQATEHLQFSLVGKNLTDEDYLAYSFQYPNGFTGVSGARGYASYGRPRLIVGFIEWTM